MNPTPGPAWPQQPPPGMPPGVTRGPAPLDKRMETLGTVCLVVSILELLYCAQRLLSPLFSHRILDMERSFMPARSSPPQLDKVMEAADRFMDRIALWEAGRTVPFVVATCVLLWIAIRVRRGDTKALGAARTWALAALGVVATSALVQVLVTIPATMEYQRQVMDAMAVLPPRAKAPFDIKGVMSAATIVGSIGGLVMGTMLLSVWPVTLYLWAGRLLRDATQAAEAAPLA